MKLSLKKNLLFIFFFTTFSLVQAHVSAAKIKTLNTTREFYFKKIRALRNRIVYAMYKIKSYLF